MAKDAIEDALNIAADHFGVDVAELRSQRRTAAVHNARVWAAYLAAMTTEASFEEIGSCFGRDHTIVRMYARARSRDVAASEKSAHIYAALLAAWNASLK